MCHLLFGIRAQFTHVNGHGTSHAVLVSQGPWEQEGLSWDVCRRAASATAALVEAPGTLYQELVGSVGHVIVRVHFSGLEDSRTLNNTHTSQHTAHTHTCTCSHLLTYIPLCTLLYTHAHAHVRAHIYLRIYLYALYTHAHTHAQLTFHLFFLQSPTLTPSHSTHSLSHLLHTTTTSHPPCNSCQFVCVHMVRRSDSDISNRVTVIHLQQEDQSHDHHMTIT